VLLAVVATIISDNCFLFHFRKTV